MQIKTLIVLIATGLMISSGLVVLADNASGINANGDAVVGEC